MKYFLIPILLLSTNSFASDFLFSDCAYSEGNFREVNVSGSTVRFGTEIVVDYTEEDSIICISHVTKRSTQRLASCGRGVCQIGRSIPETIRESQCFTTLDEIADFIGHRYCETGLKVQVFR